MTWTSTRAAAGARLRGRSGSWTPVECTWTARRRRFEKYLFIHFAISAGKVRQVSGNSKEKKIFRWFFVHAPPPPPPPIFYLLMPFAVKEEVEKEVEEEDVSDCLKIDT